MGKDCRVVRFPGWQHSNKQQSAGASIHKIMGSHRNNVSFGLGFDVGSSEGHGEKNSTGHSKRGFKEELIEHKLSYRQAYAQVNLMLHNAKELGIGVSYKKNWGQVSYSSGLLSSTTRTPQNEEGLINNQYNETSYEDTNIISYGTFALTIRSNLAHFVSERVNLDLQFRASESIEKFKSNQSLTFRISYDFE